jgi:hypothetical protein
MNTVIHHLDKHYQPLQLSIDFHDNQNRQGCIAIHEDSLYTLPTMHLAFVAGASLFSGLFHFNFFVILFKMSTSEYS